ncbi:MAG: ABC transporter ATP-binding protein [Eubacterium sp.]|nr:ABC transporter ATP-binding protein [Eubacterium sp.]
MKRFLKYLKPYTIKCILAPLFKMLEATFELLVPLVIARLVDVGIDGGDRKSIIISAILLFVLAAVGMAAAITAQYFSARVAMDFGKTVRGELFRHIESLSYSNIDRLGTSTLITRMTSDVNQMQTGVNMILRLLLRSPFIVFGATIMAFTVNAKVAKYFIYILIALFIVVGVIVVVSIPLVKKVQERLDNVTLHTRENIVGVRVIRAFNRSDEESEEFHLSAKLLMKKQLFVGRVSSFLNPVTLVIINTGIACVVYNGGMMVHDGGMAKGEVIALYNYMSYILVELIKFVNFIITVSKMFASARRVANVMDVQPDITYGSEEAENVRHTIDFENVSMTYKGSKAPAISDISLHAEEGEIVGVIGGTGSGKTTLVNLIPRFYEVTSGLLKIDGKDVKDYSKEAIRSLVAVTPQHSVLFSGSVEDNLKMGRDDITSEELEKAVTMSQSGFINEKEGKLAYQVSAGGRNLSGGQRQRLCIARCFAKNSPIIILDDSASALDFATEKSLRQAIASIKENKIIFIVSQRIGSIMNADKIVVMEKGSVAGIGTHDELMESCDVYREIYTSQVDEKEVAS